jgi:hypothetical protein
MAQSMTSPSGTSSGWRPSRETVCAQGLPAWRRCRGFAYQLDEFIGCLLAIRDERGGDALVVMSDYKPVVPPRFVLRESFMGNEPPQPFVIITDRLQEGLEVGHHRRVGVGG